MRAVLVVIFTCLCSMIFGQSLPEQFVKLQERFLNKKMPSLRLKLLNDTQVQLDAEQGKVIMVNFWSITCGPCIKEILDLNRLVEKYKDKVLFFAVAPEADKDAVSKLVTKHNFKFNIAYDSQAIFDQLNIEGYPKNFFVDQNGIVKVLKQGTPYTKNEGGEWVISAFDDYSKIINDLLL